MFKRLLHPEALSESPVLPRNFTLNIIDGGLFALGMSIISQQTILPIFVKNIGGTNIAVGLIPVLWMLGFNFPQIFFAHIAQRMEYKKKFMLETGLIQRLPYLGLAIVSYLVIADISSTAALLVFFTLFTVTAIGGSVHLPVWFDLISKITPVTVRGRLFAYRSITGGILGIGGGWLAMFILGRVSYPANFALLFFLAFIIMMVSFYVISQIREERPTPPSSTQDLKKNIRNIPAILINENNFRNYLIADALLIIAASANAFYTVHAFDKFFLEDLYAGLFTIVMMVSTILSSIVLGLVADNFGHRLNVIISALGTVIACVFALLASNVYIYLIVFFISAFTINVLVISRLSIVVEMCNESERPTFIALTNMLTSPFVLSGVLGGWIANVFGYNIIFYAAGFCALTAGIWLLIKVKEPRNEQAWQLHTILQ
jgi:MFS family permease